LKICIFYPEDDGSWLVRKPAPSYKTERRHVAKYYILLDLITANKVQYCATEEYAFCDCFLP